MGKVGKYAKEAVKVGSGYSALKGAKDMVMPSMPDIPQAKAPEPVAPATRSSENVQQAKDNQRRQLAGRTGRSQSSILNPAEAMADDEKDILG